MNRVVTEPLKQCSALGERVQTKARSCSVTLVRMIDDFAKGYLHADLRWVRRSLLFKLEGLSEYDVRRPLTKTGTNLLGLIKHLNLTEERDEPGATPTSRRRHADATIEALPIEARGFVPWWPQSEVKLLNVMVHVLTETNRHAGHADILREQLDGAVGAGPAKTSDHNDTDWEAHRSRIETAAHAAASGLYWTACVSSSLVER